MKKILKMVSILAMIPLLAVSFSSCKPRPLAIESVYDNIFKVKKAEMKKYENIVPPAEKTVTFQGREYKLEYSSTDFDSCDLRPYYAYSEVVGYPKRTFEYDFDGNLVDVELRPPKEYENKVTVDYCISQAENILSEYADDITQYQISASESYGRYIVRFKKYINNIETSDFATVRFTVGGELDSMCFSYFDRIPVDLDMNLFDMKTIRKAVFDKAKKNYPEADSKFIEEQLSKNPYVLYRRYNGQYYFMWTFHVDEYNFVGYYVNLENRFPLN